MTNKQIVNRLRAEGYSVSIYVRKDGGILIRSINGIKFSGAKGNAYARTLVGETLSERREKQLHRAVQIRSKRQTKYKVSDQFKKELQRVQRHWRKKIDVSKTGQPTLAKLRWRLENEGEESAHRLLREWERYTEGIAYTEVVKALFDYIMDYANKKGGKEHDLLSQLADDIWAYKDNIRDEWIQPAYDALYKLNTGGLVEDVDMNVRRILRLP